MNCSIVGDTRTARIWATPGTIVCDSSSKFRVTLDGFILVVIASLSLGKYDGRRIILFVAISLTARHRFFGQRRSIQNMKEEILRRLEQIEAEDHVTIFYACESGSRAWGFPSADSDYDVRFIYLRPTDWYLSIDVEEKRDVIERPINDELDVSGWDLRKALQLLRKSNPPLLEWLSSRIVYRETHGIANMLRAAVEEFYSPISSFHHYRHMAEGNFREYLKGDVVRAKKYFYVLRPLLAMRWIEEQRGPVPMEFEKLVDACVEDSQVRSAISGLLERKKSGKELDGQPKIPALSVFIEQELNRLKATYKFEERRRPDFERLNIMFRNALKAVGEN